MGKQDGKMGSKDAPPFATASGKVAKSGDLGSAPGHDFVKDNTGAQSAPVPGHDFTRDSRAQSTKKEVEPSPAEMPAGGPVLKLDKPAAVGTSTPVGGGSPPWKGMK